MELTGLNERGLARLLRVAEAELRTWLDEQAPVPSFVDAGLAALCGVPVSKIQEMRRSGSGSAEQLSSTILFRVREEVRLSPVDLTLVATLRQVGRYEMQLASLLNLHQAEDWSDLKSELKSVEATHQSPAEQGIEAAKLFRQYLKVDFQAIGEAIRPLLHRNGFLFFETGLKGSNLKGGCFPVESSTGVIPCAFVNSFGTSWFDRNETLLHEMCHGVFDIAGDKASFDFEGSEETEFREVRAAAFAKHALLPVRLLKHAKETTGIDWENITQDALAHLVAVTHAPAHTILRIALEEGFISSSLYDRYNLMRPGHDVLKKYTPHALSLKEYLAVPGINCHHLEANVQARKSTTAPITMVLPVSYVSMVLAAVKEYFISPSKASAMLFITEEEFDQRFEEALSAGLVEA
jgi:Zn-dependent peptidase ImmA (M78 family)